MNQHNKKIVASQIRPPQVEILGVPVSIVTLESAVLAIASWIRNFESQYVCIADVHSLMRARHDLEHRSIFLTAGMVTPDGLPLVWVARRYGISSIGRVSGTDLMEAVCRASAHEGWRHYFYGNTDTVLEALSDNLRVRYPGLQIVGCYSPPFRPLTEEEDSAIVKAISETMPHIVWVSLGCPKQEKWMITHANLLPGTIIIGVGAAFDFISRKKMRAPIWMQNCGLEWLHRFMLEPKRLWRRYLIIAPQFVVLSSIEAMRMLIKRRFAQSG